MEAQLCQATKKDGTPCTNKAKSEFGSFCGVHKTKQGGNVLPPAQAITITFGDCAENHVGMQKLGNAAPEGFTYEELLFAQNKFSGFGATCELIHLNTALPAEYTSTTPSAANGVAAVALPTAVSGGSGSSGATSYGVEDAYVLIIRNGVDIMLGYEKEGDGEEKTKEGMMAEQQTYQWDTKAIMYKKLVNKHARYNVCYADEPQVPRLEEGKGTVIAFSAVPHINHIRDKLPQFLGVKASSLYAEGNLYYDTTKCGIGFHGDFERVLVVACRLGAPLPLHYQWFHRSKPIGERVVLSLNGGDMYVMSAKAVGQDWKHSSKPTLRHAAGADKYLKIETS